MIKKLFNSIYSFTEKNKFYSLSIFAILAVFSFVLIPFLNFNNDMNLMLPEANEVKQSFTFLREAGLSDKIVISLTLNSNKHSQQDLFNQTDILVEKLHSPYITKVQNKITNSVQLDFIELLDFAPYLYNEKNFQQLNLNFNPTQIKKRFAKSWRNLIGPGGIFTKDILINDPISIKSPVLKNFTDLLANTGCRVKIEDGRFVSEDNKSTMLILDTSKNATDAEGAKQITSHIYKCIEALPDYINADAVGGHFHTTGNESVVKKDIGLAVIISGIIFFILFAVAFRDRYYFR